jgi:hypothetical protein
LLFINIDETYTAAAVIIILILISNRDIVRLGVGKELDGDFDFAILEDARRIFNFILINNDISDCFALKIQINMVLFDFVIISNLESYFSKSIILFARM